MARRITKSVALALGFSALYLFLPRGSQVALADITCENSDYNCIYTNGSSRIVCTRSFCGPGTEMGRTYRLEGLYAFDGPNPNNPTTTAQPETTSTASTGDSSTTTVHLDDPTTTVASGGVTSTSVGGGSTTTIGVKPLSISASGATVTATGAGSCAYSGGTYRDAGYSSAWNTTSRTAVPCSWTGSFMAGNLEPGRTYFLRVTFYDSSGSMTATSSFVASVDTTTTTTIRPVSTTTASGFVNPCLDPANPNYACGWAILGPNNQVGGVIVCTFAVCGSGVFGGMRLVLQTQQMEGGNVAGWSGGTYNEDSQTFSLPGGGTLRSGDKLEEAVFPTTTITESRAVDPGESVSEILASSGVIYKNSNAYVNGESEIVITANQVVIDLPPVTVREADYVLTFDPDGPARESVIERGRIVDGSVVVKPSSAKSANSRSPRVNTAGVLTAMSLDQPLLATERAMTPRISVNRTLLRGRSGLVRLKLATEAKSYGEVAVRVDVPKKYSSCAALLRDYPGGVSSSSRAIRDSVAQQKTAFVKATLNVRVYALNKSLDADRDRIACEDNR